MEITVIIVGIGQWKEYTREAIHSVLRYNPNVDIIIVDNGSNYTTQKVLYNVEKYKNVRFISSNNLLSYSSSINLGLRVINNPDWVIILNNDIVCTGSIEQELLKMDINVIYGNKLHKRKAGWPNIDLEWIDGWLYAIPYHIIEEVGQWDEQFKIAHAEDLDYCIRAKNLGYDIKLSFLPFTHLEEHIRKTIPKFKEIRRQNKDYLYRKHGLYDERSL